jgi:hypothetical protein
MTRKPIALFAAAAVIGGLVAPTTVFAREPQPPSQPPRTQGMMGDHGGMNMMGQMSPDHMKQMTAMIDNCNRMMESMSKFPAGPDK